MPKLTKKKYLPKEFENMYFGMTLEEFQSHKNPSSLKIKTSAYVSYVIETVDNKLVDSYIYQFDKHRLLYEIIIQYKTGLNPVNYITENFGKPNHENELLIQVKNSLFLKIWAFHQRICIANAAYYTDELRAHQAA